MFVLPLKPSTTTSVKTNNDNDHDGDPLTMWFHQRHGVSRDDKIHIISLRNVLGDAIYSTNCHEQLLLVDNEKIVQDLKEYYSILVYLNQQSKKTNPSVICSNKKDCILWKINLFFDDGVADNNNAEELQTISFHDWLQYESACVLWNLAALESHRGYHEVKLAGENEQQQKIKLIQHLTAANKYYCTSATIIDYLCEHDSNNVDGNMGWMYDSDFSKSALQSLKDILLSQGQACAYQITLQRTPNMHSVLCKLSYAAYECFQNAKTNITKNNADKTSFLLQYITCQQLVWKSRSEYHKGMECWKGPKKQYGYALTRLKEAHDCIHSAIRKISDENDDPKQQALAPISLEEQREWTLLKDIITEVMEELSHDNETIYKQHVPSYHELCRSSDPLKGALMAKVAPKSIDWCSDPSEFRPAKLFTTTSEKNEPLDPSQLKKPPPQEEEEPAASQICGNNINAATARRRDRNRQQQQEQQRRRPSSSPFENNRGASFHPAYAGSVSPLDTARFERRRSSNSTTSNGRRRSSGISRLAVVSNSKQEQSQEEDEPQSVVVQVAAPQDWRLNNNAKEQKMSATTPNLEDAMKLYSKTLMQVFDQCDEAATKVKWETIQEWVLDRHAFDDKLTQRFDQFQIFQKQYHDLKSNDNAAFSCTTTTMPNASSSSLLPSSTLQKLKDVQQNDQLDEMSMRLWQLKETSQFANQVCQQIESSLKETIQLDDEFCQREEGGSHHYKSQTANERIILQVSIKDEFYHYKTLLEGAQSQGDVTLFQLLDDLQHDSKYKLLRMSVSDIEQLIAPTRDDRERLRQQIQTTGNNRSFCDKNASVNKKKENEDPMIKAALALDVSENKSTAATSLSFRKKYKQLYNICVEQDTLLNRLNMYGQDEYLEQLHKRLLQTSNEVTREQMIQDEINTIQQISKNMLQNFTNKLSILFQQVQREYRIFSKAEQALKQKVEELMQQQEHSRITSKRPAAAAEAAAAASTSVAVGDGNNNESALMIRYHNMVQGINDALTVVEEKMEQVKDGEQFYSNLIPRLESLKTKLEEVATTLMICRCELEDSQRKTDQLQKDHEAAALLARQLEEEEQRQLLKDERLATELARHSSSAVVPQSSDVTPHGAAAGAGSVLAGEGGKEEEEEIPIPPDDQDRHAGVPITNVNVRPPGMVIHAPSELTACSTLGDPLQQQQHTSTDDFLQNHPHYGNANGGGGGLLSTPTRPRYIEHDDRMMSDVTLPVDLMTQPSSSALLPLTSSQRRLIHLQQEQGSISATPSEEEDRRMAEAIAAAEEAELAAAAAAAAAASSGQPASARGSLSQPRQQRVSFAADVPSPVAAAPQNNISFTPTFPGVYQVSNRDGTSVQVPMSSPSSMSLSQSCNNSNNVSRNHNEVVATTGGAAAVDDAKVAELVAMGFDAMKAYQALEHHDNNLDQALNELLS